MAHKPIVIEYKKELSVLNRNTFNHPFCTFTLRLSSPRASVAFCCCLFYFYLLFTLKEMRHQNAICECTAEEFMSSHPHYLLNFLIVCYIFFSACPVKGVSQNNSDVSWTNCFILSGTTFLSGPLKLGLWTSISLIVPKWLLALNLFYSLPNFIQPLSMGIALCHCGS